MNIKTGRNWINLDSLVDVESLLGLNDYLCEAVARSSIDLCFGGRAKPEPGDNIEDRGRPIGKAMLLLQKLAEEHPARIATKDMTRRQKQLYLALRYNARCEGELIPLIIRKKGANLKSHNGIMSDKQRSTNYVYFEKFFDWVEKQNIFTEYGRTNAFLSLPFQTLLFHKDSFDIKGEPPEFIWVRTSLDKDLSIMGNSGHTNVEGHVVWFNGGCYHRAEVSDNYTFSIRVDGFFTEEFRQKIADL
jgi:hypothetical protein